MKAIALLNACKPLLFGGAGVLAVTGGVGYAINASNPPEVVEEAPIELSMDMPGEVIITDILEPDITTEPDPDPDPEVQKQYDNEATGHTAAPGHSTPEPAKDPVVYVNPENGAVNRKYLTQNEFEQAYIGYCPQDVPAGMWVDKLAAGVSLGYLTSSVNIYDPMSSTDYIFSVMKSGLNYYGPNDGFAFAEQFGINTTGSDGVDQWRLTVTIDWSNRKIGWRRIDGGDNSLIGTRLISDMNELTSRMTARLHQREAEFKAKCGW